MPRLIIDSMEVEVPEGTKVIDAAERLGIVIPRFCYHEALGTAGACRVCAVKFIQGPFKGVQMSCMIDAQDGMVVSTTDEEAVAFRKQVIEWLMINHPHDCPVCDEGGQCLLQDETVSGGHGIRRYEGKKRTYKDQYLGPFISHEMNRCIHCYRCSRFYREYSGYRDLGPMQIANKVYFGRFKEGILESPFAGNLADLCPTGVYTDKTSRYRVRRWDLDRSPSICIHCSLGCNTVANARYRELMRVEARPNRHVNGYFICDRGRFGYPYANLPERPRRPVVEGGEVSLEDALQAAAGRLRNAPPETVACLGSLRTCIENQAVLKRLCTRLGWSSPAYFTDPSTAATVRSAISRLKPEWTTSLQEVEKADFILAVGADPINEAPVLALAMRQAFRKGGAVAVLDPRPIFLPFDFMSIPTALSEMNEILSSFSMKPGSRGKKKTSRSRKSRSEAGVAGGRVSSPIDLEGLQSTVASRLLDSRKPVIVLGTDLVSTDTIQAAAALVDSLRGKGADARIFTLLPGPNAFGAALMHDGSMTLAGIVEGMESGRIRNLLVVESDLFWNYPHQKRLERALESIDSLILLDYLPSKTWRKASVFLPTSTIFEMDGHFINSTGQFQFAHAAHVGGAPIRQVSGYGHPPRVYLKDIPDGAPKPAWQILLELACALEIEQDGAGEFSDPFGIALEESEALASIGVENLRTGSKHVDGSAVVVRPAESLPVESPLPDGLFQVLLVDWTFGTEELSAFSQPIREVERAPVLTMHADDAADLGLADGEKVALSANDEQILVRLKTCTEMARGTLILPRHRGLEWRCFTDQLPRVGREQIKKM